MEGEDVGLDVGPAVPIDIVAEFPETRTEALCPTDMVPTVDPLETSMLYSCTPTNGARLAKEPVRNPSSSAGTSENSKSQLPEDRQ
jgi:hypothetical protein